MFKLRGDYASAVIYSDSAEQYALSQIKAICDNPVSDGSSIAVMPDVHPGKVAPIGFTMNLGDKIMPLLIGSDIGCGVTYIRLNPVNLEYEKLDKVIRENISVGNRKTPHRLSYDFDYRDLVCGRHIDEKRAYAALGTLGGGNHFIELERDDEGDIYVLVHSGSRYLGGAVTEQYMRAGRKVLKAKGIKLPYELTYLEGQLMEDYISDVRAVQGFAMLNREIILYELEKKMKLKPLKYGESIHNYVDENRILRKGAVSAYEDDEVIIPINMRDGVILGRGKGNKEWNYSAPHGAGRVMNRETVLKEHTVSEFKNSVKDIHSVTVGKETLDEAPFAYRGIKEIAEAIGDTVEIKKILKPLYNYRGIRERR